MLDYFKMLRESGLPIDWTTIQEGRNGFGHFGSGLLTRDQLTGYAKERLGEGTSDEQYLVFQIVDAGLQDFWTVDRCLAELAASENTAREVARRRWLLAAVKDFVQTPWPYLEDEAEDYKYCLDWLWLQFDLPDGPPDLPYYNAKLGGGLDLLESVRILREWIRQEEARVY